MKRSHKIRAHTQSYTLVVHHMMSYYTNSKLYSNVSPLTTLTIRKHTYYTLE